MPEGRQASVEAASAQVEWCEYRRYVVWRPWLRSVAGFTRRRGARVLEIGCDDGQDLRSFLRGGAEVVGMGTSLGGLQAVRQQLGGAAARLVAADRRALPFRAAAFDLVYLCDALQREPQPRQVLDEGRRCLAGGGELLIVETELPGALKPAAEELVPPRRRRFPTHRRSADRRRRRDASEPSTVINLFYGSWRWVTLTLPNALTPHIPRSLRRLLAPLRPLVSLPFITGHRIFELRRRRLVRRPEAKSGATLASPPRPRTTRSASLRERVLRRLGSLRPVLEGWLRQRFTVSSAELERLDDAVVIRLTLSGVGQDEVEGDCAYGEALKATSPKGARLRERLSPLLRLLTASGRRPDAPHG